MKCNKASKGKEIANPARQPMLRRSSYELTNVQNENLPSVNTIHVNDSPIPMQG
jgi:hypothetical protein